jgi:hypothetical protein
VAEIRRLCIEKLLNGRLLPALYVLIRSISSHHALEPVNQRFLNRRPVAFPAFSPQENGKFEVCWLFPANTRVSNSIEYDRQRGGVSAAGSNDTLGYFLDANFLDYEGWQERTDNERKQFSSKLLYTPDIDVAYSFRVEYLDRYQENPGSLTQAQYDEGWQQALVYDAYNDEKSVSGTFKYERDLSSHSGMEFSYGIRNNLTVGPPSYSSIGGFSSSDVTNHNLVALYRYDFDWYVSPLIVGVDLLHSDDLSKGYADRDPSSDINQKWDIRAIIRSSFMQYEVSPKSWLHLSLGGRYDRIEYAAKGYKVSRGTTTDYPKKISWTG